MLHYQISKKHSWCFISFTFKKAFVILVNIFGYDFESWFVSLTYTSDLLWRIKIFCVQSQFLMRKIDETDKLRWSLVISNKMNILDICERWKRKNSWLRWWSGYSKSSISNIRWSPVTWTRNKSVLGDEKLFTYVPTQFSTLEWIISLLISTSFETKSKLVPSEFHMSHLQIN